MSRCRFPTPKSISVISVTCPGLPWISGEFLVVAHYAVPPWLKLFSYNSFLGSKYVNPRNTSQRVLVLFNPRLNPASMTKLGFTA